MAVSDFGASDYVDLNLYDSDETPVVTNPLHLFLQELELCIKTQIGSIWGINEGINLHKYVYNRFITLNQIRNDLVSAIQHQCIHSSEFNYDISVDVIDVDGKQLIYIQVNINYDNPITGEIETYLQKFVLGS